MGITGIWGSRMVRVRMGTEEIGDGSENTAGASKQADYHKAWEWLNTI